MRLRQTMVLVLACLLLMLEPCASDADDSKARLHKEAQAKILKIKRSLEQGEVRALERDMARQAKEVHKDQYYEC